MDRHVSGALVRTLGVAAAARGRKHEAAGRPCEDAVAIAHGPVSVVALADGAGSASHAALGASTVVRALVAWLPGAFDGLLAAGPAVARRHLLAHVDAALAAAATAADVSSRELASTLLFAAMGPERYLAGHLGDGVLCARRHGLPIVLGDGARGEFAGETTFVPTRASDADLRLFTGDVRAVDAFALLSDGAESSLVGSVPYAPEQRRISSLLARWWDGLGEHPIGVVDRAVRASLDGAIREHTQDDCSIALIRRVEAHSARASARLGWLGDDGAQVVSTRSRVARAWRTLGEHGSAERIGRALHLRAARVRRHLEALARLGWRVES
jgi:hypothetical protein